MSRSKRPRARSAARSDAGEPSAAPPLAFMLFAAQAMTAPHSARDAYEDELGEAWRRVSAIVTERNLMAADCDVTEVASQLYELFIRQAGPPGVPCTVDDARYQGLFAGVLAGLAAGYQLARLIDRAAKVRSDH